VNRRSVNEAGGGRPSKPSGRGLVDSHAHLQADRFRRDVELVIGGAKLAGVERILVPGWNLESCAAALALMDQFSWLDPAVGVHPHEAATVDDAGWASIVRLASDPRVVAVGETGLDYDRLFAPVEAQLANLRRNLELAVELGRPAIIHCRSAPGRRDAQDALLVELRLAGFGSVSVRSRFGGRPPAVIHSYSGPVDFAEGVLGLGLAVSFSGLVFRRGEEASAVVAGMVPADRLLVETDSPFLSPPGAPRQRNEPEWVRVTAAWLAHQRGVEDDELGDDLVAAYDTLFRRTSA
jgi:TatD DNase family protein